MGVARVLLLHPPSRCTRTNSQLEQPPAVAGGSLRRAKGRNKNVSKVVETCQVRWSTMCGVLQEGGNRHLYLFPIFISHYSHSMGAGCLFAFAWRAFWRRPGVAALHQNLTCILAFGAGIAAVPALHQYYKRLQEEVVCSESNYHL